MHKGLRIYFVYNPRLDHRIYLLCSLAKSAWIGPIRLSCPGGKFYGLQSRISKKMYSEPLMHALLTYKSGVSIDTPKNLEISKAQPQS